MYIQKLISKFLLGIAFTSLSLATMATNSGPIPQAVSTLNKALAENVGGNIPVIVKLKDIQGKSVSDTAALKANRKNLLLDSVAQTKTVQQKDYTHLSMMALQTDSAGLAILRKSDLIDKVYPDRLRYPLLLSSTRQIQADLAWSKGRTGSGSTIAVLDTGVNRYHEMMESKVKEEACFSTNATFQDIQIRARCFPNNSTVSFGEGSAFAQCDPCYSGQEHGNLVAGIAAGNGPSLDGVARDANLIAVNVFSGIFDANFCGIGNYGPTCLVAFDSDILAGLDFVFSLRDRYQIAAVNLSLGSGLFTNSCDSTSVYTAVFNQFVNANIAIVAASGNESSVDSIIEPACVSKAIAVGSVSITNSVSVFSNSSHLVDFLAPGEQIYSSGDRYVNHYIQGDGTSFAAPHVAGAIAILRAYRPQLTVAEIVDGLKQSGLNIRDPRNNISKPLIQIDNALELFKPPFNLSPILQLLMDES